MKNSFFFICDFSVVEKLQKTMYEKVMEISVVGVFLKNASNKNIYIFNLVEIFLWVTMCIKIVKL